MNASVNASVNASLMAALMAALMATLIASLMEAAISAPPCHPYHIRHHLTPCRLGMTNLAMTNLAMTNLALTNLAGDRAMVHGPRPAGVPADEGLGVLRGRISEARGGAPDDISLDCLLLASGLGISPRTHLGSSWRCAR